MGKRRTERINPAQHFGLVGAIAGPIVAARHGREPLHETDEFQDGCVGLVQAAASRTFDPKRTPFVPYAKSAIIRAINRGKRQRDGRNPFSVPLPRDITMLADDQLSRRELICQRRKSFSRLLRRFCADDRYACRAKMRARFRRVYMKGRTFADVAQSESPPVDPSCVQASCKTALARISRGLQSIGLAVSDILGEAA